MKKEFLTFTVLSALFIVVYFLFPNLQDNLEKKDKVEMNFNSLENQTLVEPTREILIPLTFDIVRISKHGDTVIAGKSEPNSRIELLKNDNVIASFFSDGNGDWVWVSEIPLEKGIKEFYLRFTDENNIIHRSDQTVLVLDNQKNDKTKPAVAKIMSNDAKVDVLNLDSFNDGLAIDSVSLSPNNKFIITGRTLPDHEVEVSQSSKLLEKLKSDNQGKWNFTSNVFKILDNKIIFSIKISGEVVTLPFDKLDFKKKLDLESFSFERNRVVVESGNSLWRIARKTMGSGIHYTEIYKNNAKRIKNPNLIYPGQVFNIPNLIKKIYHE